MVIQSKTPKKYLLKFFLISHATKIKKDFDLVREE